MWRNHTIFNGMSPKLGRPLLLWLLLLLLSCSPSRDENGILLYDNLKEKEITRNDVIHPSLWIPVTRTIGVKMQYRGQDYNGPIAKYYDNGNLEFTGYYEGGFRDGIWKYYSEQGYLEYEVREGRCSDDDRTDYFPNGSVQRKFSVRSNCNPVEEEEFYSNGSLKYKCVYEAESGNPISYIKNRVDGKTFEYYHQDSILIKKNHKTLKTEVVKRYNNGVLHGESIYYHENSTIRKKEFYNKGYLTGGEYQEYYSNGQLETEGYFENSQRNGIWNEYYEDGTPRLKSVREFGKLTGPYIEYYPNGKPHISANYRYGLLDGNYSENYESGLVKKAGIYRGDHKIGTWKYFDETGNLTKTEEF